MLDWFKRNRVPLLLGCLLLTAMLLYSANLRYHPKTTLFEKIVLQVTAPLHEGLDWVLTSFARGWHRYVWLMETEKEDERLRIENRRLQSALEEVEEIRLSNRRLRDLLDFKERMDLPAVPAQVIAEDVTSWFRTVMIDKGAADGIQEGMPVVAAQGVVGRIIKIGEHQARVLLVTDASSAVSALIQRTRTRGIVRGQGEAMIMEFALRLEDVAVGDRVVTSGTGGVFPKGLPAGTVKRVEKGDFGLFQSVEIEPLVDFSRLEEVMVLLEGIP